MKSENIKMTLDSGCVAEFRSAEASDAQAEIDYLQAVCAETPFLMSEAGEMKLTPEGEEKYIKLFEDSPNRLMLNAWVDGFLAGNGSIEPAGGALRLKHRADMGIALRQEYWGRGIGTALVKLLIAKAAECGYEYIELDVYSNNTRAIALYEKLGFEQCGRIKNGVKYSDGTYTDLLHMQRAL